MLRPDEVLDAMADVIEERGHTKFDLEDGEGRVCLFGAYNLAVHGAAHPALHSYDGPGAFGTWTTRAHQVILDPLVCEANVKNTTVAPMQPSSPMWKESALIRWNNAPETEQDDVVNACRWAAKRLRDQDES